MCRYLAAAALLAAAAGSAGCSHTTYTLREGECFTASAEMLTGAEQITDVDAVSCTRAHNSEVVGTHPISDTTYPGPEVLVTRAQKLCQEDFRRYVGIDYQASAHDLYPLIPTEDTWKATGARTITCVALTLPATRESLRNAGNAAAQR